MIMDAGLLFLASFFGVAGLMDLCFKKVDNLWILFGFLMIPLWGIRVSVPGMVIAGLSVLLYIAGLMGAGDVKLFMVAGCVFGGYGIIVFILRSLLCGVVIFLLFLAHDLFSGRDKRLIRGRGIPLAPAMLLAVLSICREARFL